MTENKKSESPASAENVSGVIPAKEKFNWFMAPLMFVLFFVPLTIRLVMVELDEMSVYLLGRYEDPDFYCFSKGVFLMIGMAVMLAVGVFGVILLKKITKETDWRIKFFLIVGGAFILFTLLSASLAENITVAYGGFADVGEGFFTIFAYIVIFMYAMLMFEKTKDFKCIAITLAIVIGVNLILGISQYIGQDILRTTDLGIALTMPSEYRHLAEKFKFTENLMYGTLGHYNHMGTFTAMVVPLFTVLTVISKDIKMRIAMGITAVMSAVLLFGSTARGGLVGLAFAALFAVIIFSRQIISHWKITLSVVGAGVVLAVGLNFATGGKIFNRIPGMISDILYIGDSQVEEDYLLNNSPVQNVVSNEDGTVTLTAGEKELVISFDTENKFTISDGTEKMALKDGSEFGEFTFEYIHQDRNESYPEDIDVLTVMYKPNILFALGFRGMEDGVHFVDLNNMTDMEIQSPEIVEYFKGKEKIGSARGYIWGRTIPLMKDTMFVGYGPDNFVFKFPQHDYFGKYYAYNNTYMLVTRPHNLYLQIFVNNGGLAFLAFMAIIILYIADCFKLYCFKKSYTAEQGLGTALFLAVAGYLGAGMFNDSLKYTSVVFWALLGMGAAVNALCRKAMKEQQ